MTLPIICDARYADTGLPVLAFLYPPGLERGRDTTIGSYMGRKCTLSEAEIQAMRLANPVWVYPRGQAQEARQWAESAGFNVDDRRTRFDR